MLLESASSEVAPGRGTWPCPARINCVPWSQYPVFCSSSAACYSSNDMNDRDETQIRIVVEGTAVHWLLVAMITVVAGLIAWSMWGAA